VRAVRLLYPRFQDPPDVICAAFEDYARVVFGELELHRRNPLIHLAGLDLSCYDRDYGPQAERDQARLSQLARWPQAVDVAVAALDRMSAPVAAALLQGIRGLAAGIPPGTPFEDIPNDWFCPVCGARKRDFELYEP